MSPGCSDALALLELDSLALGYRVLDALVKRSPVEVLEANLVEPGKFLILFVGGVAEVEEAREAGLEQAGEDRVDELYLPFAHPQLLEGLRGELSWEEPDTLGVIEARSVASTLAALDRCLKEALVELMALRVTPGLGGRGYGVIQGLQHDVEAGLEVAEGILRERGKLHRLECIPRPHPDFLAHILRPAPFALGRN